VENELENGGERRSLLFDLLKQHNATNEDSPTSSLSGSHATDFSLLRLTVITATVIELHIKRVWYRTPAIIRRLFSSSPSPETPTTRPSYFAKLPVEILEMIIVHLIYNKRSLLACSLTCYSWYIVAVPHLHHTLITLTDPRHVSDRLKWPKPLRDMHKLGLLPLVKKLHIHIYGVIHNPSVFPQKPFSCFTLRHFSALTNVRELGIDYLDIPSFIPSTQRYFGHLSLTVHSLALREPEGSRRQIIHIIGLFKHLEDLKLLYDIVDFRDEPADDPTLVPPFIPPLRGRLTVTYFTRVGILEDMIDLFGGIRFRYMDLFNVNGMRLLLDTCAETLETLRLYPTDPCGRELSLSGLDVVTDDVAAVPFIRDFDLSRNRILRTLEVTGRTIDGGLLRSGSPDIAIRFFTYVLSTITSPAFTEVTVFYREYDFVGVSARGCFWLSPAKMRREASWFDRRFEVFRAMQKVRDFQLVLCADTWDEAREHTTGALKQAVAAEKEKRRFDDTFLEPLVTYSPRGSFHQWPESRIACNPWIPL